MKAGYTIEHDKNKLPFVTVANFHYLNEIVHYSSSCRQELEGITNRIGTWQPKGTKK